MLTVLERNDHKVVPLSTSGKNSKANRGCKNQNTCCEDNRRRRNCWVFACVNTVVLLGHGGLNITNSVGLAVFSSGRPALVESMNDPYSMVIPNERLAQYRGQNDTLEVISLQDVPVVCSLSWDFCT